MELKQWTEAGRGRATALAAHLRVPVSFVSKMVSGEKPVPIAHMAAIEAFTQGAVSRRGMRPDDWQSIWPELADTQPPAEPPAQSPQSQALPPEAEPADLAQPMDLAGQCDNNRRAAAEPDDAAPVQPPDIDGETEGGPSLGAIVLPADTGDAPPPPAFSGQEENGRAPDTESDDCQPVLVLDTDPLNEDRKAA